MIRRECILYDNRNCDGCGDCEFCDINPDKICDNCGKCIDSYDYSGIQVDELLSGTAVKKSDLSEYSDDNWKFTITNDDDRDESIVFIDDIEKHEEEDYCNHDNCNHEHHHEN